MAKLIFLGGKCAKKSFTYNFPYRTSRNILVPEAEFSIPLLLYLQNQWFQISFFPGPFLDWSYRG
jgi:hypothetical protein